MIAQLRGQIVQSSGNVVTVDVHGVGYEVFCSSGALARCGRGEEVTLIIHTDVKEDLIRLYGFADQLEKQVFLLLTRVKGVGAKSASDIISKVEKIELLRTIAAGDTDSLQKIRGIGKKTSERIVVELRDKVGEYVVEGQTNSSTVSGYDNNPFGEALLALMALGFPRKDAERAVKGAQDAHGALSDPGAIVKEALRFV